MVPLIVRSQNYGQHPVPQHFSRSASLFLLALSSFPSPHAAKATTISPSKFAKVGVVDDRFQSYNVEMVEVTGGRFWKPYDQQVDAILAAQAAGQKSSTGQPTGMDPALYQYRTPIDLAESAASETRQCVGTGLSSRERHVAKFHLLFRFGRFVGYDAS